MPPILIPKTNLSCYVSFKHALNLRYPSEDTGEWHFNSAFFDSETTQEPRHAPLAGDGGIVDTNAALGTLGVREMSDILVAKGILSSKSPVYIANHYRAIADLAMLHLRDAQTPQIANNRAINSWLDAEHQVQELVRDYLSPLRFQLHEENLEVFEKWLATVHFD